ncbi:alpha/beta fold hydrolase [Novosphingobium sp. G106]|uniref:alpha/beta fold hydrolase n=1 Tax=Novosphingobium sp. G106 TaxID=2849500 RepID=UPI001C2D90E9|nr:alpha/beta fold hydrolase [Novosphingobium sp. G106]MBV1691020.1 alpha/beta fold hydrolase [Novosphingobium sp. G106]
MTPNDTALLEPGWRERWCEVGDTNLHVIEAGRAGNPMFVMLHGFPEFWWAWRYQITPLAEAGFHVVAPDLRGYNLSTAPQNVSAYGLEILAEDIVRLAEALGSERFYLAGHDWGAVIGWVVAACYPEQVMKAVLISGPHPEAWVEQIYRSPAQLLRSWYVGFFQLPWLSERILGAFNFARLKAALRRSAKENTFSSQKLKPYVGAWARPGALSCMLAYYRALRRPLKRLPSHQIKTPVEVIWGNKDRFLGRGLMEASLARCAAGPLTVIDDGTHWLHLEQPELIAEHLVDLIGSHPKPIS